MEKKESKDDGKWKNETYEGEKQEDGDGKQQTMKIKP